MAGEADFVAALHLGLDLALNRQARLVGILELAQSRRPPDALARQRNALVGANDDSLDAVADRELEGILVVFQVSRLDHGLALAADVDQRGIRPNRHDRPLNGLAAREAPVLDRRLEHGGEIFYFDFRITHGVLL